MTVTAARSGIQKLYHYEPFCPKYLEDTLVSQRIHFSNPKNFNDPWDCYPCLDTTQMTDPDYRARCIEYFQKLLPNPATVERRDYERRLQADGPLMAEMCQSSFRESIRNMIVKGWRVYCLARHADKSLMWSHYSDHHRGICLEFDASQSLIGSALQVKYSDTLPAVDMLSRSAEESFQIFVTKSTDWIYESEYRILARDGHANKIPHRLPITNNDFLPMPPGALKAVIAGCRADVDTINELVKRHAPGVPVKRAVQAPDRYSLSIQD